MTRNTSICTASLALALALQPWHIATAASHCKGLAEAICGNTSACKWQPKVESKRWRDADGKAQVRKAHCRLDVAAAAKIAAGISASGASATK